MAYPAEFRRDVVAVARRKQAPMGQIAKDFGISESCLHRWVRQADSDEAMKDGISTAEATEMRNVLDRRRWATREELRLAIIVWIERTYHRRRRQRGRGKLTPVEFETVHEVAHAA